MVYTIDGSRRRGCNFQREGRCVQFSTHACWPVQAPAVLVAWVVAAYSALGHKEFRFLYPVLPLVHSYAGAALAHIAARRPQMLALTLAVVLVSNIPMAVYFSVVHQQGTIRVVEYLRDTFALQVCFCTPTVG